MSNPFDYVNSILQNKKNLIVDELTEKDYSPFLVNRTLSYHKDCILYANEMNRRHLADKKLQYDFLLNTIRSQKRPFAKWVKAEKSEDLECIKQIFGLSDQKAREARRLLSDEQIQKLKEQTDTGGLRK
jgi:Bacteriophage clamp loader A subunit